MTAEQLDTFIRLLVFALLCSTLIAYLSTPLVMWFGKACGFMDQPNERRIHTSPIPRCGGLAVFAAFSVTLIVMFKLVGFVELTQEARNWASVILPVTLPLLLLGLADDKWELSPPVKLLGQIAVAVFAWNSGMQLGKMLGFIMPVYLDVGMTVLLYLLAMNAYNLIDGMDGVAAGIAAITSVGLCGLNLVLGNEAMAAICLALTGACLGFLRYNFHPARVFLGDTGSLYIGFLLMSLTLGSQSRSTAAVLFIIPLLTMGVPMIDTGLAIWRRSVRKAANPQGGKGLSHADKDHLHHRLARQGFNQRKVAGILYGLQATIFIIGLLWLTLQNYRMAIFTAAFFAGSYVILRYLATLEMTDSGRWVVDGIRRPGRAQLYRSAMPFLDILAISLSVVVLSWLLGSEYPNLSLNLLIKHDAVSMIGCPVILIWALKYYRLQWTRVRPLRFFYLGVISVGGLIIGISLSPIAQQHTLKETILFSLVMMSISLPLMMFLRIFPRLVHDFLHYYERQRAPSPEEDVQRVLIYGAGYGYTLIVRSESFTGLNNRRQYQLIGLVDDDPNLKGCTIHGQKVLGSGRDLELLCDKHDIQEILISTPLDDNHQEHLLDVAERLNLRVSRSMFTNEVLRENLTTDFE